VIVLFQLKRKGDEPGLAALVVCVGVTLAILAVIMQLSG
jgi:hypothetical protein